MQFAFLIFDGFNEIDSFVGLNLCSCLSHLGLDAFLVGARSRIASMSGVQVDTAGPLSALADADVVVVGSGVHSAELACDGRLLRALALDPQRQLIGAQCSGAFILHALGLLEGHSVSTDARTGVLLRGQGCEVTDKPLSARGSVATAGGCLSATYLAAWAITRMYGWQYAAETLSYVAPNGEHHQLVERAQRVLRNCGDEALPLPTVEPET